MRPTPGKLWLGLIASLFALNAACAAESTRVLTLEAALATVEAAHPDLQLAQADRDSAVAERDMAASRTDTSLNLEGILRSGVQTVYPQEWARDNSIRLTARKTLYDFGRSDAAQEAANLELNAREADLIATRDKRRLEIMLRYFDVLLADLQYTEDNELMAVYYVSFDQGKDRLERGQISSVQLAELESRYQDILLKRNTSAQRQRITRAMLANAMNRPGDLPSELQDPALPGNQHTLPDYEKLIPILLENNSRLRAHREMLAASQKRLESLRAENNPTLDAEVQAADYSRSANTRDNLSAGVILSWPLYQGNRSNSRVAREQAQFYKLQAGAEKLQMELTQALLETYIEVTQLQGSARNAARVNSDYRDLLLERSRGLYELELKSNLGTSMVETAAANLRSRRNEYQLALGIARLEAILGISPWENLKESK